MLLPHPPGLGAEVAARMQIATACVGFEQLLLYGGATTIPCLLFFFFPFSLFFLGPFEPYIFTAPPVYPATY